MYNVFCDFVYFLGPLSGRFVRYVTVWVIVGCSKGKIIRCRGLYEGRRKETSFKGDFP